MEFEKIVINKVTNNTSSIKGPSIDIFSIQFIYNINMIILND